jgi:hypothetical protein
MAAYVYLNAKKYFNLAQKAITIKRPCRSRRDIAYHLSDTNHAKSNFGLKTISPIVKRIALLTETSAGRSVNFMFEYPSLSLANLTKSLKGRVPTIIFVKSSM